MARPVARRAVLVLALASLLPACGGSGGGGGGPPPLTNAALSGTYFAVQFSATATAAPDVVATTGTLTADGLGGGTRTHVVNDTGTISGPITQAFTYAVAGDGVLDLKPGLLVSARGGVTADGGAAVLGMLAPDFNPGVYALFRRDGLYSLASLSGAYHMALFTASPSTGDADAYVGPVDFDGLGNASFSGILHNHMATITSSTGSFTCSVAGDGASIATIGAGAYPGGVVAGGALGIWGGSTTANHQPALLVVVKAGLSATLATLRGEYWVVLLIRRAPTGGYISGYGEATADGLGGLALTRRLNLEGMSNAGTEPGTYTVGAGGTLGLALGSVALVGGISDDGRFALAGGELDTAGPMLYLLVRKD
jgi:hypothetical protein